MTMNFVSQYYTPGGKFNCSIETYPMQQSNCYCGWKNPVSTNISGLGNLFSRCHKSNISSLTLPLLDLECNSL